MQANPIPFLQFISGEDKRFTIPVFQRNYDWKEQQCRQLFQDICNIIISPNRSTHFMGTIVYISNSEVEMVDFHEYVVIDGQQRITTIMLLLKAIYDTLQNSDDYDDKNTASKIYEHYLINKYANSQKS